MRSGLGLLLLAVSLDHGGLLVVVGDAVVFVLVGLDEAHSDELFPLSLGLFELLPLLLVHVEALVLEELDLFELLLLADLVLRLLDLLLGLADALLFLLLLADQVLLSLDPIFLELLQALLLLDGLGDGVTSACGRPSLLALLGLAGCGLVVLVVVATTTGSRCQLLLLLGLLLGLQFLLLSLREGLATLLSSLIVTAFCVHLWVLFTIHI